MGRCPVRSIFPEALALLAKKQDLVGYAAHPPVDHSRPENANSTSFMFDTVMPLTDAVEGYELFDNMKAQKIIFKP